MPNYLVTRIQAAMISADDEAAAEDQVSDLTYQDYDTVDIQIEEIH